MNQSVSKNTELEEWAIANEHDVKEWALHTAKKHYKNAIISNSVSIAVLILAAICFFVCLMQILMSFGEHGIAGLVISGLIEAFYLVTGLTFSLPSMLKRCITNYGEITKGNCHVVIARYAQVRAAGEDGWRDVVCEGLDGKTVDTLTCRISEERIASELGAIRCLVYVGEKCRRVYNLEDARQELGKH